MKREKRRSSVLLVRTRHVRKDEEVQNSSFVKMASSPVKSAASSLARQKSRSKSAQTSKRKSGIKSPERTEKALSAHSEDKWGKRQSEAAPLQLEEGALDVPATLFTGIDHGASSPGLASGGALSPSASVPKPSDSEVRPSTTLKPTAPGARAPTSLDVSPAASPAPSKRSSEGRLVPSPRRTLAEEVQAIIELRELAEKGSLSHESPYRTNERSSPGKNRCPAIAAVAVAVVAVSVSILTLRLLLPNFGQRRPAAVCTSAACEIHRVIIGADRLPQGQNPCLDFGRFVCAGWNNTQPVMARTVFGERVNTWLLHLSVPGTYSDPKYTVLKRVAQMAADCKDQTRGHDAEAVTALVQFMTREFFPWLVDEFDTTIGLLDDDYYTPLSVLFQLAAKWSLPMWFNVYLSLHPSKAEDTQNHSISLRASAMGVMWKRIHDIVLSYRGFYTTYVDMFVRNVYERNNVTSRLYLSFLANSSNLQGHIFNDLSNTYLTGYTTPVIAGGGDLPSFERNISADKWFKLLQASYTFQPPITKRNLLFASNDVIITSMTTLLKTYSARDITFHTAWWLTQILGAHTSKEISYEINLDKGGSLAFAISCGLLMSASYHVLIASINLSGLTATEQTASLALLKNVYSSALDGLRSARWINNMTRKSLAKKLAETTTTVWPDERYRSDESMLRLYGNEYNNTLGFFGHWLSSRKQLQRSMGSVEYALADTLYKLDSRYMASYNPFSEVITVAEAALHPPFFYPRATSAILYGGLGFVYAQQIVRSLHTMAAYVSRWEPLNSNVSFWHLLSCPEADDPHSVFPNLPAMAIAHAAYRQFRNDAEDLRLKGMEQFSAEQVFFLTACHGRCEMGADGQLQSEPCNIMVRNFRPFSRAFSCPPGSPMNPKQKCSYL